MKNNVQLLNTSHVPQAIKDIASRWISKLKTLSRDIESDVEDITSFSYVDEGEVEKIKVKNCIDTAVKSLIFLLEDEAGYNGRLLTLSAELVSIQYKYENPESNYCWGFYVHCCQIVFDELFSSKKK